MLFQRRRKVLRGPGQISYINISATSASAQWAYPYGWVFGDYDSSFYLSNVYNRIKA